MELEMQEAYSEVYEIISYMPKEYSEKIPEKLKSFFEKHRSKEYQVKIDKNNLLDKSKLKSKTIDIIAMLNIKYWCSNEKIKKELLQKYNENEIIYQKELEERYNIDNIFESRKSIVETDTKELQIVEYKEPKWYKKIFKKILKFFKISN